MVSTELMGGLGNLMFQMSAAISLAHDNNDNAVFSINAPGNKHWKSLKKYQDNIFCNINFVDTFYFDQTYIDYIPFKKEKILYKNNILLRGYFINKYYFIHNSDVIYETFFNINFIKNYILDKYKNIDFENSTSIHIRRGDYVPLKDHHPLCSMDYYSKGMDMVDNSNFIIFSNDIKWCKNNFIDKNIIFIEDENDYIEMYMMSMCKNNIIANSTFSWWSAWANKNQNSIIIAPEIWLGPAFKKIDIGKDKYIDSWNII
jgi:hypothetical protein